MTETEHSKLGSTATNWKPQGTPETHVPITTAKGKMYIYTWC